MFKSVGKILGIVGKVFFFLFPVAGLLIGGITGGTGAAIVLLLAGIAASFVIAMPIIGFGKLIDDVDAIRNK